MHRESGFGGFDAGSSVRIGKQQVQNVTHRDSKRPKERTKDKAYKQRFSMISSSDMTSFRPNFAFQTESGGVEVGSDSRETPAPSGYGFGLGQDYPRMPRNAELPPHLAATLIFSWPLQGTPVHTRYGTLWKFLVS